MPPRYYDRLSRLYERLLAHYGEQHWWPAETPFEMIVGAYLTQNTSWRNVELALANLRRAGKLSVDGIRSLPLAELEALVRPSGFFRQKAARLHAFVHYLDAEFHSELRRLLNVPAAELRTRLLALPGVGKETADSIILYAAHQPVFVVDLYTRRLFAREGTFRDEKEFDPMTVDYDELRLRVERAFEAAYPEATVRTRVYNEFHALIVVDGKADGDLQRKVR